MHNTPLTDAKQDEINDNGNMGGADDICESLDFARTLERALAAANERADAAELALKLAKVENNHNWQAQAFAEEQFAQVEQLTARLAEAEKLLAIAERAARDHNMRAESAEKRATEAERGRPSFAEIEAASGGELASLVRRDVMARRAAIDAAQSSGGKAGTR